MAEKVIFLEHRVFTIKLKIMKKIILFAFCIFFTTQIQAQEDKQKKANQLNTKTTKNTKKAVLVKYKPLSKPTNSNFIGSGNFSSDYPNFYTFWDNKYWPIHVISIQYQPRTTLTVPTNKNHMSLQVTGKTDIPGQDIINTGPPIYETSDLKFYEILFRNSKDYIIVFNLNGQGTMMYYHKSLAPDYFKP